jgi:4a-hydroxytetrahydrobiopterin dehydratase
VVERHRIYRDLRLPSFRDAVAFITRVGDIAERLDHHPNIFLHEYFFVRLELYSHIDGGISQRDVDLALAIDEIAGDE